MFPGRFWVSLGSGEAINEIINGEKWPSKADRNACLMECALIVRSLLEGETVFHRGLVTVENAQLCTLSTIKPLLIGAAVSVETAGWIGSWADGLITVSKPIDELTQVVNAFRENGGKGKPMYLKVQSLMQTRMMKRSRVPGINGGRIFSREVSSQTSALAFLQIGFYIFTTVAYLFNRFAYSFPAHAIFLLQVRQFITL